MKIDIGRVIPTFLFEITGEIIDADLERPVAFSVVRKPVSLEKQSIV